MEVPSTGTRAIRASDAEKKLPDWSRAARRFPWLQGVSASHVAHMIRAYELQGGLAAAGHLVQLLRTHNAQPLSVVARWILAHRVVHFVWLGETFVPLFQFERPSMAVGKAALAILFELSPTFEDAEIARWLTMPNAWLNGQSPLTLLEGNLERVLQAARADRFIAVG